MFDDLIDEIEEGIKGVHKGLPIGHSRLGQHVYIKKGIYTLIGGNSGTGKTAFLDSSYVLNPYEFINSEENVNNLQINWLYNSMERPKTFKIAKWVCIHLQKKHNILLSVPEMLGWKSTGSRIDKEVFKKIKEARKVIEPMLNMVFLYDGATNPTGIFQRVADYADERGINLKADKEKVFIHSGFGRSKTKKTVASFDENTYIKVGNSRRLYVDIDIIERGKRIVKRIFQHSKFYIPLDENLITLVIGDHFLKLKGETHDGKMLPKGSKELLDIMSAYNGEEFRDYYNFSPVWVSQFNRGTYETDRRKILEPQESDFKGTGNLYDDSDIVFGLFNPTKFQIDKNLGYDVSKFRNRKSGHNRYRSVYLLKNSYGIDSVATGFFFQGENGRYTELPRPNDPKLNKILKEV